MYGIKIYELRNIGRLEATEILLLGHVGVCLYITASGGGTGGEVGGGPLVRGRRAKREGKEGQGEWWEGQGGGEGGPGGKEQRGREKERREGRGVRRKAEEREEIVEEERTRCGTSVEQRRKKAADKTNKK